MTERRNPAPRAGLAWRIACHAAAGQAQLGAALVAAILGVQLVAAGLALDVELPASGWVGDAALLLTPSSLAVGIPTAMLVQAWRWRQDGRWAAAAAAGVAPAVLAVAAGLVWLPLLACEPALWHRVQPAARARLGDALFAAAFRSPTTVVGRLPALGVAAAVDATGGGRALLPWPEAAGGALGAEWRGLAADPSRADRNDPHTFTFEDLRVTSTSTDLLAARRAHVRTPPWRPSLADRSERQLSTALLIDNPARWRRARQVREPFPARTRARQELWRRHAGVATAWLAWSAGLAAWWRRPVPGSGPLSLLPVLAGALAFVVFAPRWVAALAAAWPG